MFVCYTWIRINKIYISMYDFMLKGNFCYKFVIKKMTFCIFFRKNFINVNKLILLYTINIRIQTIIYMYTCTLPCITYLEKFK